MHTDFFLKKYIIDREFNQKYNLNAPLGEKREAGWAGGRVVMPWVRKEGRNTHCALFKKNLWHE
jgi:hypothetical protein